MMTLRTPFLLTVSFLSLFPVWQDAQAKSFRSNYGVAFVNAKKEAKQIENIETASGEVDNAAEVVPTPVPTNLEPRAQDNIAAPVNLTATECSASAGNRSGSLFSFYHTAQTRIEKSPSGLKVFTNGGAVQFNGDIFALKRLEILPSSPPIIRLTHEDKTGKPLTVDVPVVVGQASNPMFEIIISQNNAAYFDINQLLPMSREYVIMDDDCAASTMLALANSVALSSQQIEKFKSLF